MAILDEQLSEINPELLYYHQCSQSRVVRVLLITGYLRYKNYRLYFPWYVYKMVTSYDVLFNLIVGINKIINGVFVVQLFLAGPDRSVGWALGLWIAESGVWTRGAAHVLCEDITFYLLVWRTRSIIKKTAHDNFTQI